MGDQGYIPSQKFPLDLSTLPENVTVLLGAMSGYIDGVETACSSKEFYVRHIIGPVVEATLASYFDFCVPESEKLFSDNWSLCQRNQSFNCDNIRNYTSQCKIRRDEIPISTPTIDSRSHSQTDGTLMLFAMVALVIGIVIGVILIVVICLVCPSTYRWASNKLGRSMMFVSEKSRQQSVVSDYYAAIDDRNNHQNLQLQPVQNGTESATASNEHYLMHQNGSDDVIHSDVRIPPEERAPAPDPEQTIPRLDHQESCDYSSKSYEQLDRQRPHNQSHNYDHIGPTTPLSPDESEHSYFVLERTNEAS